VVRARPRPTSQNFLPLIAPSMGSILSFTALTRDGGRHDTATFDCRRGRVPGGFATHARSLESARPRRTLVRQAGAESRLPARGATEIRLDVEGFAHALRRQLGDADPLVYYVERCMTELDAFPDRGEIRFRNWKACNLRSCPRCSGVWCRNTVADLSARLRRVRTSHADLACIWSAGTASPVPFLGLRDGFEGERRLLRRLDRRRPRLQPLGTLRRVEVSFVDADIAHCGTHVFAVVPQRALAVTIALLEQRLPVASGPAHVVPVANGSSWADAQVFEQALRVVEYISKAPGFTRTAVPTDSVRWECLAKWQHQLRGLHVLPRGRGLLAKSPSKISAPEEAFSIDRPLTVGSAERSPPSPASTHPCPLNAEAAEPPLDASTSDSSEHWLCRLQWDRQSQTWRRFEMPRSRGALPMT
jgi:hypothetical protein